MPVYRFSCLIPITSCSWDRMSRVVFSLTAGRSNNFGSIPGKEETFSPPKRLDRACSLLFNGMRGVSLEIKRMDRKAGILSQGYE